MDVTGSVTAPGRIGRTEPRPEGQVIRRHLLHGELAQRIELRRQERAERVARWRARLGRPPLERVTVIERVCAGAARPGCGRTYGGVRIPWRGQSVLVSHGVCLDCARRERAALEEGKVLSDSQRYLDRSVRIESAVSEALRAMPVDVAGAPAPTAPSGTGARGVREALTIIGLVVLFGFLCAGFELALR